MSTNNLISPQAQFCCQIKPFCYNFWTKQPIQNIVIKYVHNLTGEKLKFFFQLALRIVQIR